MKQGWERKKIGDCFESIKNGANIKQERGATGIPITRIETLSGGVFNRDRLGYANILSTDKYASYVLDDGDLLLSHINSKTYIGRTVLYNKINDEVIIHGMNLLRLKTIREILSPYYTYYCFKSESFKNQVASYRKDAVNQSSIPVSDLKKINIPVPPLPEQEKIVAELDCLSGIIEKKRQQLKELDALAQSIFYEMFGDPVTNEKGWEVKKLKDVCLRITDGTHNSPKSYPTGKYKYITAKNIKKDGFDMSNITYVLEDIHRSIYDRCNPAFGDILYIKDGATTGIAMINTLNEEFSLLSSVALLKCDNSKILNLYLRDMLNTPSLYRSIRDNMGGVAITRLTLKKIEEISILLPPLPLQQTFASKMEAIEKQKELIKQSINEVETLFNSRMQEYFG